MKWFLSVLALASVAALGMGSCGPEQTFCPTTNPDQNDLTCHENFDAATGMGGQNQGPCDGASYVICPNGGGQKCSFAECP
jgi:hypothetical protein